MFFFTTPTAITAEKQQDVNQVSRKQLGSKTLTKAIARTCGQVSRLASLTRLETKDYPMISHVRPTKNKSKQHIFSCSPCPGWPNQRPHRDRFGDSILVPIATQGAKNKAFRHSASPLSYLQQKVQGSDCCRMLFVTDVNARHRTWDMYWAPLTGSLTGALGGVVSKIDFVIKPNDARRRFVPVSSIDVKLNKFWMPMTSVKKFLRGWFCDECQWHPSQKNHSTAVLWFMPMTSQWFCEECQGHPSTPKFLRG